MADIYPIQNIANWPEEIEVYKGEIMEGVNDGLPIAIIKLVQDGNVLTQIAMTDDVLHSLVRKLFMLLQNMNEGI